MQLFCHYQPHSNDTPPSAQRPGCRCAALLTGVNTLCGGVDGGELTGLGRQEREGVGVGVRGSDFHGDLTFPGQDVPEVSDKGSSRPRCSRGLPSGTLRTCFTYSLLWVGPRYKVTWLLLYLEFQGGMRVWQASAR